jgi:hypothetical protein
LDLICWVIDLLGDLVGQFAGACEHFDFHIGKRMGQAGLAGGANIAAAFAPGGHHGVASCPCLFDDRGEFFGEDFLGNDGWLPGLLTLERGDGVFRQQVYLAGSLQLSLLAESAMYWWYGMMLWVVHLLCSH